MDFFLRLLGGLTLAILAVLALSLFYSSIIGILLVLMLAFGIAALIRHQRGQHEEMFNAALRRVCRKGGDIQSVALGFSCSGLSSSKYYEYTRRLMMGQDATLAAVKSKIQLELSTAIVMQLMSTPDSEQHFSRLEPHDSDPGLDEGFGRCDLPTDASQGLKCRGQVMYLAITGFFTAIGLFFCVNLVVPSLQRLRSDYMIIDDPMLHFLQYRTAIFLGLLLLVGCLVVILVSTDRNPLARLLARYYNVFPSFAEHKAKLLHGMADAIDVGWPIGKALAIAHMISNQDRERLQLQQAMEWIEQGNTPLESIKMAGWIDSRDIAWLESSPPARTAEVMRTIGNRQVRDSVFNFGWVMEILYPVCLCSLALVVGWYCYGFIEQLYGIVILLGNY